MKMNTASATNALSYKPNCIHCGGKLSLNFHGTLEPGESGTSRCIDCDKFTKVTPIFKYRLEAGEEKDE